MPAVNSLWAQLTDAEIQVLEPWLVEFDRTWDEKRLEARVKELPPVGHRLRLPALVELVKIDLEKQWARGRRPRLEAYLHFYPELGTPETVPGDLVQAEYEVRRRFETSGDLADLARRFPRQAERLRQLTSRASAAAALGQPLPAELPEQFGRYRILKKLGQGGMGAVYLAQDTQLDRRVALKVPFFKAADDRPVLERFYREARAAATLEHPNLCPVHDVGQINGTHYLTMAFIEGRPLSAFVGQPLPQVQVAAVVRKLALALAEAHGHGVVHRDLKPANVMINQRREPVIMDFGLARRLGQEEARLTQDGHLLGTPAYMAPEQVRGEADEMGPACDIYALGVILYELLTGRLPFQGPVMAVVAQIIAQEPEPPSQHRPELDAGLEAICLKAMAKQATDRYRSMTELAAALGAFLQVPPAPTELREAAAPPRGEESLAAQLFVGMDTLPGVSSPTRVVRLRQGPGRRRRPLLIGGMVAATLVVLLSAVIYVTTNEGTIRIELSEPAAKVEIKVDGNEVQVTGLDRPLRLRAGKHGLHISSDDFETVTREFTVRRGDNPLLRIELVPRNDPAQAKPTKDPNWITNATGKQPVPEASLLQPALARLREAYRTELASSKPADRARLVQTLLERAAAAEQVPVRYALFDLARQSAAEAGDLGTALDVCSRMNQAFLLDLIPLKVRTLEIAQDGRIGWPIEQKAAFRATGLSIGFEALALDDYPSAADVVKIFQANIEKAAEKSGRGEWTYQIGFLAEEAARGGPAYQRVRRYLDSLAARPDDPRASTEVGKYQCFNKNDWARGLRLLSQGDDPVLRDLAQREQQAPTAAADLAAVGDAWWSAADKAGEPADYRRRARVWYLKALGKTPSSERGALARRVQSRIDSVPVRPVTLAIHFRGAGGSPSVVISNEGVDLRPTWAMKEFSVNHLTAPGGTAFKQHRNTGAWRLYPDAIDFGSAEFLHEFTYRFGAMSYHIEPHQLVIQLISKTTSTYDADFTVSFQAGGFVVAGRFDDQWEVKFFSWETAGNNQRDARIPAQWKAVQAGATITEQRTSRIDFMACRGVSYWPRLAPPAPMVPHDYFALVGTTEWELPAGRYEVRTLADDGIRVLIDGQKVLERWKFQGNEADRAELPLTAGKHRVRIEYFQETGAARLQFALRRLGDVPSAAK